MAVDFNAKGQFELSRDIQIIAGIAAGSLAIFAILYILAINPIQKKIGELSLRYQTISRVNTADLARLSAQRDALLEEKNKLNTVVEKHENMLSGTKHISNIIDKFVDLAKKRRLEFTYFKPHAIQLKAVGDEKQQEQVINLKEVPVSLGLEADFSDFLQFLWDTEHIDKTLKITRLSIERTDAMRHKEQLELSILQLQKTEN